MKVKTEMIVGFTPQIETLPTLLKQELQKLLPNSNIEFVGAMAVPMVGRPELDVMIISEQIGIDSQVLVENDYKQGPLENGISFLKKMQDCVEIGVQIMSGDNKMVNVHRNMIQILRKNDALRHQYEDFKRTLSGLTREEYKKQKSKWIRDNILPKV